MEKMEYQKNLAAEGIASDERARELASAIASLHSVLTRLDDDNLTLFFKKSIEERLAEYAASEPGIRDVTRATCLAPNCHLSDSLVDFQVDDSGMPYATISIKRRVPAITLLKALGYTTQDILKTFYLVDTIKIARRMAARTLRKPVTETLIGTKTTQDIVLPYGSVPGDRNAKIQKGTQITRETYQSMVTAGIKLLPVEKEEIVGRISLDEIVDNMTGEILAESNESLTEKTIDRILAASVDYIHLLVIDSTNYSQSIHTALLMETATTQAEAIMEIYKAFLPDQAPTIRQAKELFNGSVANIEEYSFPKMDRLELNRRLHLHNDFQAGVFTEENTIEILRYLLAKKTKKQPQP